MVNKLIIITLYVDRYACGVFFLRHRIRHIVANNKSFDASEFSNDSFRMQDRLFGVQPVVILHPPVVGTRLAVFIVPHVLTTGVSEAF